MTIFGKLYPFGADSAKFHQALTTVHRVLTLNEKPQFKATAYQTLGCYYEAMLGDPVRAFHWYRQLADIAPQVRQVHDDQNHNMRDTARAAALDMARCYAKLGLKEDALATLKAHSYGDWRELLDLAAIHQILKDVKESDAAIARAVAAGRNDLFAGTSVLGRAIILYCANGNLEQVKATLPSYRRAYAALAAREGGEDKLPKPNLPGQHKRVEAIVASIERPELDLAKVADGTYTGQSTGLHGPIEVSVTVKDGRIREVNVVRAEEFRAFMATRAIPERIVASQSLKVDAVTGATVTSRAIQEAVRSALTKK